MSATQQTVVVKVWNAGKNPSVLTDAHLRFDAISSGEFPLQLGSDDLQRAVITSSTPINIVLALADERLLSSSQRLQQYKREKLIALRGSDPFGPQRMTLCIDVEEDGWWWTGGTHERCDRFPAARVSTFLEERVK